MVLGLSAAFADYRKNNLTYCDLYNFIFLHLSATIDGKQNFLSIILTVRKAMLAIQKYLL